MIKAVLLDLDETLLKNPPSQFVKTYVSKLVYYLQQHFPHIESAVFLDSIYQSTKSTIENQDALRFNADVFYDEITTQTNLTRSDITPIIQNFLQEIYPTFRDLTQVIPTAKPLVEWLLAHNYAVAIATNPLFPHQATIQRVQWAGIHVDKVWFISSLDNTHFTKPHAAYYEEILSRLGFEPDEAIMIGDDWENDIVPAANAGLNTYWVNPIGASHPLTDTIVVNGIGTLEDLWQAITKENWL
ncbi:MAG: hypothetical protein CUN55_10290, partial [Phototrophicales bacterium]